MEILKNLEIKDLCLYLKKEKILIIVDIHIGYEEALSKEGVLVPRFQFKDTLERLEKIFSKIEVNKIIINGDLKHEFGTISESEWRDTLKLLDFLDKYCEEIILIKGNHDTILGPIADKRNVKILDYFKVNEYFICHGDRLFSNKEFLDTKILIIGHEHTAISIRDGTRVEMFKCFLKGRFKDKDLIAMPSFNLILEGADVLKERLFSPFLKDVNDFRVFVISKKIYDFGKIRDLKR